MRDFLDAILTFIGSESLTDEEFDGIELDTEAYNVETYNALNALLLTRENVSNQPKRLEYYFLARDVDLSSANETDPPNSNILIGDEL